MTNSETQLLIITRDHVADLKILRKQGTVKKKYPFK
ncbi:unnamed protein product [Arabidopsis lyrata]|nr:unnamed protein product [Arabidopsis lyrata]